MKAAPMFSIVFLVVLMCGCATTPVKEYDYDTEYDFSTLKAYEWMDAPQYARTDAFVTDRAKSTLTWAVDLADGFRLPHGPFW